MATLYNFNVTLVPEFGNNNAQGRIVVVEAVNPPEAKRFAEARYPGFRATAANQISGSRH